ncbi:MAG: MopE-related protein [Flavobacteriales bacterium]
MGNFYQKSRALNLSLGILAFFVASFLTMSLSAQTVLYTQNFGTTGTTGSLPSGWTRTGTNTAANLVFSNTAASSGYTTPITASGVINMTDNAGAIGSTHIVTTSDIDVTGYGTVQLIWAARRSSATYATTPLVQWSSDGTTWNNVSYTDVSTSANFVWTVINGGSWITLGAGADNIATLKLRFTFTRSATGGNYRVDDITVRGSSLSTPTILTSGTLGSFYTSAGTASADQSFSVSGSGLGTSPIVVSAPSGFELKTGATAYSSSVSLTPDGSGSVAGTTIDVRVAAATLAGEYTGNVSCTSGAATPVNFSAQALVKGTNSAFTPGNIVVAQPSYFTTPNGGSAAMVLLREYTPAGTYVQSFEVPSADAGSNQACTVVYGSTTETNLQLSDNGQYLTWTGYDAAPGTASVSLTAAATVNRIVGFTTIDGAINTSTRISDSYDTNVIRGAVTDNGARFWTSGASTSAGGVRLVNLGSTGSSTLISNGLNNSRAINIENGQLFVSSASTGFIGINAIGTGLPTSASSSVVSIASADSRAFALLDMDTNVPGDDVAYIAGNSGFFKYYNNGTSWIAMGSLTGTSISHLTAAVNGANVDIYVTDGANMYKIVDSAGPSANISNSGSALSTVASWTITAFANTVFRGVAFAPTSAPICTFYQDSDGDGFGNFNVSQTGLCSAPPVGYVTVSGDCNDAVATAFPGATENACNSIDDDCDTVVDEGFVAGCNDPLACNYVVGSTCNTTCDYTPQTWYFDNDGDGYGDASVTQTACTAPLGYVLSGNDCNDINAAINPGVTESSVAGNICDDIDNNCNGLTDEGSVAGCNDVNAINYSGLATCADGCVYPSGFTPGNIMVSRVGAGAAALSNSATQVVLQELDEVTGAQSYLLSVPTAGVTTLTLSGTATTEGYLTRNSNGSVLIAGYAAPTTQTGVSSTTSASVPRVINQINPDFSMSRVAFSSTANSGGSVRSAAGSGSDYWTGGASGGINYYGTGTPATVSTTIANTRVVQTHNGNLYFSTPTGTARGIYQVGTGLPTTSGQTSTQVVAMGASDQPTDFQFNDEMTVCFVADDRTAVGGGIQKWVNNAGTWSLAYTVSMGTSTGARGVYVDYYSSANPIVYAVTIRTAVSTPNAVVRFTDNGTATPTLTTLATAAANTSYDGIEASPCTPIAWYRDSDGDGYGDNNVVRMSCTQPLGYVSAGGDCDDTWDLTYPTAAEDCDGRDNDCDLVVDDACIQIPDNDTRNHARPLNITTYPSCFNNNITTDLTNASASDESTIVSNVGAGQDIWYTFVATTPGVRISSTATFDVALELQTAAGASLGIEDDAAGNEALVYGNLTVGQTYYVALRNQATSGVGSAAICIQRLGASSCNNTSNNFASLCTSFKVSYTGANNYVLSFTEVPTGGDPVADVFTYTTPNAGTVVAFSLVPGLNYGRSYTVAITANYVLADGAGNLTTVAIPSAGCTITIGAQPELDLRTSDASPNQRFVGSQIGADKWICGASYYRWAITQTAPVAGLTTYTNGPVGNRFLSLLTVNQQNPGTIVPGGQYTVQIAPVFGTIEGSYGTVDQTLVIVGSAIPTINDEQMTEERIAFEDEVATALYPNPSNGEVVNVNVAGLTSTNVVVRVIDAQGRLISANSFAVDGSLNTMINFEKPLNNGLYMVEIVDGENIYTERMVVQK